MRGWSTFSFVSFACGTIPNISFVELKERADSGLVQKSGERTTFLPNKRADKVARKALSELCPQYTALHS
jgi:hypothetical protein